jgi:uncharacterized peroxidase-related enzyme
MSVIPAIDPANATGKTAELLAGVKQGLGVVPNMFRVTANSPAALELLVNFYAAAAKTSLPAKLREELAIALAEQNGCDYCLSAHHQLGKKAGLSDADMAQARELRSVEPKFEAALRFAAKVAETRGQVSDADHAALRSAGFTEQETVELVLVTLLNIFTNTVNNVLRTDIDFPVVRGFAKAA